MVQLLKDIESTSKTSLQANASLGEVTVNEEGSISIKVSI